MVSTVSALLGTNQVPDTELQVSVQYIPGTPRFISPNILSFFAVLVTYSWQDEVNL